MKDNAIENLKITDYTVFQKFQMAENVEELKAAFKAIGYERDDIVPADLDKGENFAHYLMYKKFFNRDVFDKLMNAKLEKDPFTTVSIEDEGSKNVAVVPVKNGIISLSKDDLSYVLEHKNIRDSIKLKSWKGKIGFNAMHFAAAYASVENIKLVLSLDEGKMALYDPDPKITYTPLHYAADFAKSSEVVEEILKTTEGQKCFHRKYYYSKYEKTSPFERAFDKSVPAAIGMLKSNYVQEIINRGEVYLGMNFYNYFRKMNGFLEEALKHERSKNWLIQNYTEQILDSASLEVLKEFLKISEFRKKLSEFKVGAWPPETMQLKELLKFPEGKAMLLNKDKYGRTCLHDAIFVGILRGNLDSVKEILKHEEGIKSTLLKNERNKNPLEYAVKELECAVKECYTAKKFYAVKNYIGPEIIKLVKDAHKEAIKLQNNEKKVIADLKEEFISYATNKTLQEKDFAYSNLNRVFESMSIKGNSPSYDVGALSKFNTFRKNEKKANKLKGHKGNLWERFISIFTGKTSKQIKYSKVADMALQKMIQDPSSKKVIEEMARNRAARGGNPDPGMGV